MTCRVKLPPVIPSIQLHLLPPSLPLPPFLHILSHTSCHTFTETPSPLIRLRSCHPRRNISFLPPPPDCTSTVSAWRREDDDRPTRDEKWVPALFLLFLQKRRRRGRKQSLYVSEKKSEYGSREREREREYPQHTVVTLHSNWLQPAGFYGHRSIEMLLTRCVWEHTHVSSSVFVLLVCQMFVR